MYYLRFAVALGGFLVASLYGVAIALLRRDRSRVAHDYARAIARLMQPPLNLQVTVSGTDALRAERPAVLVANHQSFLDFPVLASVHPADAVVIAKKELRRVPFFGWIYTATGNIWLDRENREQALESLRSVAQEIRARRLAVWIMPEGTRGRVPGVLLPFKKGAFQMAISTGAPLVPVVVSPLRPWSDLRGRRLAANRVEVRVLDAIATTGLGPDDLLPLLDRTRDRMQAAYAEMALERGLSVAALPPAR
jgi:1-acyl-sn-glycerol-3-phosphate acyltransferase